MKRLVYKVDTYGRGFFAEQNGYDSNIGNSLRIEDAVLNEMVAKGKVKRLGMINKGQVFNEWHEVENIAILKVSYLEPGRESFFIFDRKIFLNKGLAGKSIIDCIEGKVISVADKNSNKKKRRRPFISLRDVTKKSGRGNAPVNVGTFIYYLSQGLISSVDDEMNIVDRECHHLKYDFDNRLSNIRVLTKQQHKEIHSKEGKQSHQVQVWIKTEEEFLEFIKYMNRY